MLCLSLIWVLRLIWEGKGMWSGIDRKMAMGSTMVKDKLQRAVEVLRTSAMYEFCSEKLGVRPGEFKAEEQNKVKFDVKFCGWLFVVTNWGCEFRIASVTPLPSSQLWLCLHKNPDALSTDLFQVGFFFKFLSL